MLNKIGRYNVINILGQGNMATVYKAHDPHIDRTLAIKVLRPERCVDAEYRSRFLRESKAVGTLNHPNIVTIYDVGEVDNTPYIAMELLEGTPLDVFIKQKKRLDIKSIVILGIQISDALQFAHSRNIVHRDVKPSNIIISSDEKTAKLTDFGIARVEEIDMTQHTQIGNILGTPQYMSPEQVLGERVDARSDLFSLGTILYQLISDQKPFPGTNLASLLFQIATESPIPIGNLVNDIPASLKEVVDTLLKKDLNERYQTGEDVSVALKRVLADLTPKQEQAIPVQKSSHTKTSQPAINLSLFSFIAAIAVFGFFHITEQQNLENRHIINYGNTLSRFMVDHMAEPVLNQDWQTVEILALDFKEKYQLNAIVIGDHENLIRASDKQQDIAQPLPKEFIYRQMADEVDLRVFDAPIVFGSQTIGRIHFQIQEMKNMQIDGIYNNPSFIIASLFFLGGFISIFYFSRPGKTG
ncbi:MAG: serine/threonine protein kinase [Gammaproteobacteria bacterium]|nr:serine/threonine protein kinase [Gammaproteobacteria bacterium]